MLLLGARLARAGHAPSYFGYRVSRDRDLVELIARDLGAHVRATLKSDAASGTGGEGTPYAIVGHSLGSILARVASPTLPKGFDKLVMLAPPNRPPAMARAFGRNPVFRALTGDAGRRLQDDAFYERLPTPEVQTLVLAGNAAPRVKWLPFGDAPSDGVLAVVETELPGVDHREVHAIHTLIMNHPETVKSIVEFLGKAP
jgi:pimeloyl-ACP methyl ester carboxylesterase